MNPAGGVRAPAAPAAAGEQRMHNARPQAFPGASGAPRRRPHRLAPLLLVLPLWALSPAATALGQGSPRAWGLAGAYTAAARGLDAVEWNPANLACERPAALTLGLFSAAVDLHNNAFSWRRYNEISGATLDQADKQRLLGDVPAGGLRIDADVRASLLGLQSGPFALTVQGLAHGHGVLARGFFDLVLLGNPVDHAFTFDGTGGAAQALAAATFSAGAPLLAGAGARLCGGVSLRYLHGLGQAHVVHAAGRLLTTESAIEGEAGAELLTARGGAGWGADVALALQAPRGWNFGLVLDNAAGWVRWHRGVERRLWRARADTLNAGQADLEALIATSDSTAAAAPYVTELPRRLRLGASNRLGALLWAIDWEQQLRGRDGEPARAAISAGCEWRLAGWLSPRWGLGYGGSHGPTAAVGLGLRLGPWCIDLAAVNRGRVWPDDGKGVALAAGTRLQL